MRSLTTSTRRAPRGRHDSKRSLVLVFVLSVVVFFLFLPTRPYLIRIAEPGSIYGGILLFVPNLLRDKAPEYYAQQLPSLFQQGRCRDAVKFAGRDVEGHDKENRNVLR